MWICNKIVPNTFVKAKETLTIRANGTCFIVILCFSSVLFEKSLNHLLLKLRSDWFVYFLENYFLRAISSNTSIMLFPKDPSKLSADNIFASLLQVNLNWCAIGFTALVRINVLPFVSCLHDDYSRWRKFKVWVLYLHFSFILLVKWQYVSTTFRHFHSHIIWLMPTER